MAVVESKACKLLKYNVYVVALCRHFYYYITGHITNHLYIYVYLHNFDSHLFQVLFINTIHNSCWLILKER